MINPYKLSVFTGAVFLLGFGISLYYEFSFRNLFLLIRQITWQSNFLAFVLPTLFLWKPHLSIFYSNALFIACAALLSTASVIFAFLLLPVYLNWHLFYERTFATPTLAYVFWNIWNHFVTLIAFLNLLSYRYNHQPNRKNYFFSKKKALFKYLIYWIANALINIYFSIDKTQALPYGAIANWSWARTDNLSATDSHNQVNAGNLPVVYNFQLSFFSFFIVWSFTLFLFFLFWSFFETKYKKIQVEESKALRPLRFSFN